jgi:hypothetical protein
MDVAPRGVDMAGKLQIGEKQANCGHANMNPRRQASNLKREQANSSHCQHGHETLASYGTLLFNSKEEVIQQQSWPPCALDFGKLQEPIFLKGKKGASQQKSWPTWALDFGKLLDPIF